jgi:hypothetical protein
MAMPFSSRMRSIAAALAAFLVLAGVAAYSSSAQPAQLGSLATINLGVRKAGPEKGTVRFVQKKVYCGVGELRVQALGAGSTQAALGIERSGALAAGSKPAPAGVDEYRRIEATSPTASGAPETADTTVACPGSSRIVGGGYRVDVGDPAAGNNPAEVVVTESRAISDAVWSVTAFADDAEDVGAWSVAAYAICAGAAG